MTDLTYVITVDEGEWTRRALYLYNSINEFVDDPDIVTFIPEDVDIPSEIEQKLDENSWIVGEEKRIEDFHASYKLQAFKKAGEVTDNEYLLLLDTDVLVLNEITIHQEKDADLFVKPVDLGLQYWAREESRDRWEEFAEKTGYSVPSGTVTTTVDKQEILPYWNAGFVLARNSELQEEWLEAVEKIEGDMDGNFMAGQIALAMISENYDTEVVDDRYNYPLPHRFGVPEDVRVLHYHTYSSLLRITNREIKKDLKKTGLWDRLQEEPTLELYREFSWELLKTLKGRALGYG